MYTTTVSAEKYLFEWEHQIQYGPKKLVEAIHPFPIIDCSPSTLVALNNLPIDSLNFISTKNALLINECNFLLTFFGAEGSQQRQYGVG